MIFATLDDSKWSSVQCKELIDRPAPPKKVDDYCFLTFQFFKQLNKLEKMFFAVDTLLAKYCHSLGCLPAVETCTTHPQGCFTHHQSSEAWADAAGRLGLILERKWRMSILQLI